MKVNEVKNFGTVTLGKGVHRINTDFTGEFTIGDLRGTGEGWGLQVSASTFSRVESGGSISEVYTLPSGSLVLKDLEGVKGLEGSKEIPLVSVRSLGTVIDGGDAVPVLKVGEGEGKGKYGLNFVEGSLELTFKVEDMRLNTEDNKTVYESTISWNLLSAPM